MDPGTLALIAVIIAGAAWLFAEPVRRFWEARFPPKIPKPPSPESKPSLPKLYEHLRQPGYRRFIGRDAELSRLQETLRRRDGNPVVVVYGIGGVGKSSLALEVVRRLLAERGQVGPEERFDAFIWCSAQARVLTVDGLVVSPAVAQSLEDIFATIAIALEQPDITQAAPHLQRELVVQALSRQRTVLIVDNFDELRDDRARAFLAEVPPSTRVIVTTRLQIDAGSSIHLRYMGRDEGLQLIAEECERKGVMLNRQQAEALYEGTDGLPLAVVYAVAQMSYGYDIEHVLDLVQSARGDMAAHLFDNAMDWLRDDGSHRLILALSFFATDAERAALGEIAGGFSEPRLAGASIVRLERLSLVEVRDSRVAMRPMTRSFATGQMPAEKDWEADARVRWAVYLARVVEASTTERTYTAMCGRLDPERENLLALFEWAAEHPGTRGWHAAAEAFRTASVYFYARGLWKQLVRNVEWSSRALLEEGRINAYLETLLGWPVRVYLHWGDEELIAGSFRDAREELARRQVSEGFESALLEFYWAGVLRRREVAEAALPSLRRAVEVFEAASRPRWTTASLVRLGNRLTMLRRFDEAEACYKRVLAICSAQMAPAPWVEESIALATVNLGIVDNARGDHVSAQSRLRSGEPSLPSVADKCINLMELAIAEHHLGNVSEARRLGREARHLADRLGLKGPIAESHPQWEISVLPGLLQD